MFERLPVVVAHRTLRRLWAQVQKHALGGPAASLADHPGLSAEQKALRRKTHETIDKVGGDYGKRHSFNTAIAAVMELMNAVAKYDDAGEQGREVLEHGSQYNTPHAGPRKLRPSGHA